MRHLPDMIRQRCRVDSEKAGFLIKQGGDWHPVTWREVESRVDQIGAALVSSGVKPGDTVSILGNTRLEWTLTDLAILCCGGISVGIYQTLSGEQSAYILEDSKSTVLFVENEDLLQKLLPFLDKLIHLRQIVVWDGGTHLPKTTALKDFLAGGTEALKQDPDMVKRVEQSIRPEDVAIIIYTSGTTGPPKGACLTHKNILAELKAAEVIGDDRLGNLMMFFLPLSHVGERVAGQYMRISRGITAAYVKDISRILEDIVEIRPTFFGSVPRIFEKAYARIRSEVANASPFKRGLFQWAEGTGRSVSRRKQKRLSIPLLLQLQYQLADRLVFRKIRNIFGGRVRYFLSSSAPISVDILEFFHACGMLVLEGYGQTEVSCFCTLCTPEAYRFGSVGRPLPGIELKIAADGEIMVRGDIVFPGYLNQPELNRTTLTPDGWIYTGDLGKLDDDGYLWITGRKKEIIVTSGGKNVTPSNIENLLMNHPLIELAMVHGDRRNYLTALLSLSPENLTAWGKAKGYGELEFQELIRSESLIAEIQQAVDDINRRLARFETIKKFSILPKPLTVETGELTPTMKVRRKIVEAKYKELLDAMYTDNRGVIEQIG
ncbi:MAG: AMP-dependent synthetase/ligase [Thermodesulfobacteriota bacterium]